MNREIKFRAWDKDKKEMFYQSDNTATAMKGLAGFAMRVGNIKGYTPDVMQFTGLKDKNGKEIYEGDILSGDYPDEVFWSKRRGQWMLRNAENPHDTLWEILRDIDIEIIGNIYENPELLEGK